MTNYPTNVKESRWQVIVRYFDVERSRKYDLKEIINAIFYIVKTGCQWRMLPDNFAPWQTVYYYFSKWKKDGTIEWIHEQLVEKSRKLHGKKEEPTAGIIDSQSVKNTLVSCQEKGFDAGKKICR